MQIIAERHFENGDDALAVRFMLHPVQNQSKSREAGRAIFEDKEYIEITSPGGKDVVHRPVKDEDKDRFPRQYLAFKNKEETQIVGTPLSEFSKLTKSQVEEMKAQKIYTVEQLASLSDEQVQRLGMGGLELRGTAKAFIMAASDASQVLRLAEENEKMKEEIESLKQDIKELVKAAKASSK